MPSILITGCSSGIGYEAAKMLRQMGWQVFASCRRAEDAERLRREGFAYALQLDVDDSGSIQTAFDGILSQTGGTLDAFFSKAGSGRVGAVEDVPRQALREQFETNVFGAWECLNAAMRVFRRQGHGRIVNNSSVLGLAAMRFRGAYTTTKFALEGWSDVLRLELAGSGIYVSLIEPGPIKSHFRGNAYQQFQHWIDLDNSRYKDRYLAMINRLQSDKPLPFTLPPEAVVQKLIHAIESPRPKARYYVTAVTWQMGSAKRLLPTFLLDRLILWLAGRENQRYQKRD